MVEGKAMTIYSVLNLILWNRWQELLPNSPGYMAAKILEDLDKQGYAIVRKQDASTRGTDNNVESMEEGGAQ